MKRFFSTQYGEFGFNMATLILRLGAGILLMPHGYQKLIHFSSNKDKFMNFLGMGSTVTLSLVIFAELVCAALLAIGLFTRFAAVVLVILMSVIVFKVDHGDLFGKAEDAMLFLLAFFTLLLLGPGKFSADGARGK